MLSQSELLLCHVMSHPWDAMGRPCWRGLGGRLGQLLPLCAEKERGLCRPPARPRAHSRWWWLLCI